MRAAIIFFDDKNEESNVPTSLGTLEESMACMSMWNVVRLGPLPANPTLKVLSEQP